MKKWEIKIKCSENDEVWRDYEQLMDYNKKFPEKS
jgi:hypothetical protein